MLHNNYKFECQFLISYLYDSLPPGTAREIKGQCVPMYPQVNESPSYSPATNFGILHSAEHKRSPAEASESCTISLVNEWFAYDQAGLKVRLHHGLGLVSSQELELLAHLQRSAAQQ